MDLLTREAGPLVNAAAATLGTACGLLLRRIPQGLRDAVIKVVGLAVIAIGLSMTLPRFDPVVLTASLVIGTVIGEVLHVEEGFEALAGWLRRLTGSGEESFVEGFVLAVVVWCVGPLAIVGSIDAGLRGQDAILFTKSILDGTTAVFFASSLGWGVMGAVVVLLLYEGGIALGAASLSHILNGPAVAAVSAVGGLLVAAIGLNMLGASRLKVANALPSLVIAVGLAYLVAGLHLHI